jgi:hypothetical protein
MSRSNINLVGNTTFGQNIGTGTGVYKDKSLGNILQYKTLSVTGTTMSITSDADNIYFSAATGGGSGTITGGANGVSASGTNIVLGGTLTGDTTICGGDTHSLSLGNLVNGEKLLGASISVCDNFGVYSQSSLTYPYVYYVLDSCKHQFRAFDSGTVYSQVDFSKCEGITIQLTGAHTQGMVYAADYCSYMNNNPRAIPDVGWVTGNTGGLDAFAALTSNSNATWDTSGGLNKTWSINGSYTLTLTNVASGMYGTVKVTVTSGTPTITLSGSGITFKGNGSLASLATGTYILAWVASSATTVEWNIASYT